MPKDYVLELDFERGKETKNKQRFEEVVQDDDVPVIGSLYVIKREAENLGDNITVTITSS